MYYYILRKITTVDSVYIKLLYVELILWSLESLRESPLDKNWKKFNEAGFSA